MGAGAYWCWHCGDSEELYLQTSTQWLDLANSDGGNLTTLRVMRERIRCARCRNATPWTSAGMTVPRNMEVKPRYR